MQDDTWRDHLANERTHLAWLRTGAAVIVVGLAVIRFAEEDAVSWASVLAGIPLVLAGVGAVVYGTVRYRHAHRRLVALDPRPPGTLGPSISAGLLVLAFVVTGALLIRLGT